ncbi:hypothetical protein CHS0354_003065 [Potamilus streckersoni]|uniref:Uncharacterized protein n=1 Tax=Potamilus streckersoni TaxID=2493646 RepID=A0AAE0SE94_9BIVA|nr:hypothetical protein CHS0354_003065 [Potamilus streckersoni]
MLSVKSCKYYKAAFKMEVVKFVEEKDRNMAAHRKYDISENVSGNGIKLMFYYALQENVSRGCKARWINNEDKLDKYVLTQRFACRGMNSLELILKERKLQLN